MKHIILTTAIGLSLTACTTQQVQENWDNTKKFAQENATVVGAVAGAAIGYAVSGKSDRGLGVLAGAMAGGLIGNQLGKYLNEKERGELERYSLDQLNNAESASASTWNSRDTNASARVTTTQSKSVEKAVEIVKLKRVDVMPQLALVGETYEAKTGMNVRFEPKIADNKAGSLRKGSQFTAIGKTSNNWMLVAQNGITVGYVKAEPRFIGPAQTQRTAMRAEGIDLDAIDDQATTAALDMDGVDLDSVELDKTEIIAGTECRTINYDITANNGQKGNASFDACRGADGAWELT